MGYRELDIKLKLNVYDNKTEWVAFVDGIFKLQYIAGIGNTPEEAYKKLQEALEMYYEISEKEEGE